MHTDYWTALCAAAVGIDEQPGDLQLGFIHFKALSNVTGWNPPGLLACFLWHIASSGLASLLLIMQLLCMAPKKSCLL